MCVGPLAAISPLGSMIAGKKSVLPLISPALAIGRALAKKKKPTPAAVTPPPPTFGPSPSYGS